MVLFSILLLVGIIAFYIRCKNKQFAEDEARQVRLETEQKTNEIMQRYKDAKEKLIQHIDHYFECGCTCHFRYYTDCVVGMTNLLGIMETEISHLKELNVCYSSLDNELNSFRQKIENIDHFRRESITTQFLGPKMISFESYGVVNRDYFSSIEKMSLSDADAIINQFNNILNNQDTEALRDFRLSKIIDAIWVYAIQKDFSAHSFSYAEETLNRFVHWTCVERHIAVVIANLYAVCQAGGEKAVTNIVRAELKTISGDDNIPHLITTSADLATASAKNEANSQLLQAEFVSQRLANMASALMWLGAHDSEKNVLQYMLDNNIEMPAKLQERLRILSKGYENMPVEHEISQDTSKLYFELSSLAWKQDSYTSLFDNLTFQAKSLSYALAIRDEDQSLLIPSNISVPDVASICQNLSEAFLEEYGEVAQAKVVSAIALTEHTEEMMDSVLMTTVECPQLGILLQVIRIGKSFNLKFYTLFMPTDKTADVQRQQVLSLYQKLSPSTTMWENSLKTTARGAIQQLLNMGAVSSISNVFDGDIEY